MTIGNVATIGTFDMLHVGHIELFNYCRFLANAIPGSKVVVGVNTDGFIFRYKSNFPVVSFTDRSHMIAQCRNVDEVHANPQDGFNSKSVRPFLEEHNIKTLVVGSDWLGRNYLEQIGVTAQEIVELGITVVFKPYFQRVSSTELKNRILALGTKAILPFKGSGTLVVVPAHNSNHLLAEALKQYSQYLVVDNGSTILDGFHPVRYLEENSLGPTYELGALLYAFEKYEYDRYLLIQDSIVLKSDRFVHNPSSYFNDQSGVYTLASIAPATLGFDGQNHQWILEKFPQLQNVNFNNEVGIQYCTFSATRDQIQKLIEAKFLTRDTLATDKVGSQAWERVLGAAFRMLDIPVHHLTTASNTDHEVFTKTFLYRD